MKNNTKPRFSILWCLAVFFALIWLIIAGGPFYYLIIISLKGQADFLNGNLFGLPEALHLQNFTDLLNGDFRNYFFNSVIVLVISLGLLLIVSSFAAYPLARMKFRLRKPVFSLVVAAMSIPIHITLIPLFSMMIGIRLYDTLFALVGPYVAFNLPMSVFILTAFMRGISSEMEEAAEIDGYGKLGIFFKIIFPLSKPGLATLAIYNGVVIWNEFSFAMILTQSPAVRTLPLGVYAFRTEHTINIPITMAFLLLASLPMILFYIFGQDKLIKGMMAGAVKG
ncbi:MAG: carbohydrate ABC transporter permease [Treponema sp.]|jgi:raffinose/stachyose/melibiose transport system permease protein|nr:carbohydrate ABC transporter permease [Treponema sp.]